MTIHRAQGQRFSTVVANLDIDKGQTNESYFRWVYTLFSIVQNRIILSNIPNITPFYKTLWDESQAKLDSIRPRDLIAFDPDAEAGNAPIQTFSIQEKPLRNLYLYLVNRLQSNDIKIISYKHNNYQEVYEFSQNNQKSCSLRLYYDRDYKITRIDIANSKPEQFGKQVCQLITSVRLETDIQEKIYHLFTEKFQPINISIQSVEHHNFQEIYYLKSQKGDAKMQVFYDADGFITKIIPLGYTNKEVLENIHLALEL